MAGIGWDKCRNALPFGAVLEKKYQIREILGYGGFGITYGAYDISMDRMVAVKECFPSQYAMRGGATQAVPLDQGEAKAFFDYCKKSFLQEARTLSAFIGVPGIVWVYNCFEENGTAYFVMEYLQGQTLQSYIRSEGGKLGWKEAVGILLPVMESLSKVHTKGIVHRDVKPSNIIMTEHGAKLIDFGSARHSLGDRTMTLTMILSPGYAAIEQYDFRSKQGPFTDVYAMGMTLYHAITGMNPQVSTSRLINDHVAFFREIGIEVPSGVEEVLFRAIKVFPHERYQDMDAFRLDLIKGMGTGHAADLAFSTIPWQGDSSQSQSLGNAEEKNWDKSAERARFLEIAGAVLVLCLVLMVILVRVLFFGGKKLEKQATTAAVTETETEESQESMEDGGIGQPPADEGQGAEESQEVAGSLAETESPVSQTWVTTAGIRVRTGPSASAEVLDVLDEGTEVTYKGEFGDYIIIDYNGQDAYVSKQYVRAKSPGEETEAPVSRGWVIKPPGETEVPVSQTWVVTTTAVLVRIGPSFSDEVVDVLDQGTEVTYKGESGDFIIIDYNGQDAYVPKQCVKAK